MSKQERSYSPGWRRFSALLLQPLLHILIKQKMQGRENIPREGGVILAPNHLSYADWGTVALFSYECRPVSNLPHQVPRFQRQGHRPVPAQGRAASGLP